MKSEDQIQIYTLDIVYSIYNSPNKLMFSLISSQKRSKDAVQLGFFSVDNSSEYNANQ